MTDITVVRNEGAHRYEAVADGEVLGFAQFTTRQNQTTIWHTEVDASHGRKGVGSALVRAALDDLRARGETVVPQCSFVASFIDRHPEYADLVPPHDRASG